MYYFNNEVMVHKIIKKIVFSFNSMFQIRNYLEQGYSLNALNKTQQVNYLLFCHCLFYVVLNKKNIPNQSEIRRPFQKIFLFHVFYVFN